MLGFPMRLHGGLIRVLFDQTEHGLRGRSAGDLEQIVALAAGLLTRGGDHGTQDAFDAGGFARLWKESHENTHRHDRSLHVKGPALRTGGRAASSTLTASAKVYTFV